MNALDICAGSGIGSWVWKRLGGRTVCYVENDDYCQRLLQVRMRDGLICDAPIWDDLRSFDGRPWRGRVDFIFAGLPCQPYSVAGKQLGAADPRDLWADFLRVVGEVQPQFALVENSPNVVNHPDGLRRWTADLSEIGYGVEWHPISAADVGADHLRKRAWVVAYPTAARFNAKDKPEERQIARCAWWDTEPRLDRVADGVANQVQRLEVLGNGWVPQVAEIVMRRIKQEICR